MSETGSFVFDPDADLDSIESLPGFSVWPGGAVLCGIHKFEKKTINEKPAWSWTLQFKGPLEWTEQVNGITEKYPEPGDLMDVMFMVDNATGVSKMKDFLEPLKPVTGKTKTSEIAAAVVGMEVIMVGTRDPKKDAQKNVVPGQFYYRIVNVSPSA